MRDSVRRSFARGGSTRRSQDGLYIHSSFFIFPRTIKGSTSFYEVPHQLETLKICYTWESPVIWMSVAGYEKSFNVYEQLNRSAIRYGSQIRSFILRNLILSKRSRLRSTIRNQKTYLFSSKLMFCCATMFLKFLALPINKEYFARYIYLQQIFGSNV